MKSTILLLLVFLVLLLGFFSGGELTGQYYRASSMSRLGEQGGKLVGEDLLPALQGSVSERRAYFVRDRNVYSKLVLASVSPLTDRYKSQVSQRAGIYALYAGTSMGDINCDGSVDDYDVELLSQTRQRQHRLLDPTFGKGYTTFFSGVGGIRQKYYGHPDIPSQECMQRGDMNFNGRLDERDVNLLQLVVHPEYGRTLDRLSRMSNCNEPGTEAVVDEKKCLCTEVSPRSGLYAYAACEEAPSGKRWVQSGHGTVKALDLVPYEKLSV